MANHKSAEKRARQTERRTAVNTARRSRVRGSIKKVEEAIKAGDKKAAAAALRAAQPEIQRGAAARRDRQERRSAARVAPQRAHQGDGLTQPRSSETMNAAPRAAFSFLRRAPKIFPKFFWPIGSEDQLGCANGRTPCNSLLSDDATTRALDVEARHRSSARRTVASGIETIALSIDARDEQVESRADVWRGRVCARRRVLSKTRCIATGRGALEREPRRR